MEIKIEEGIKLVIDDSGIVSKEKAMYIFDILRKIPNLNNDSINQLVEPNRRPNKLKFSEDKIERIKELRKTMTIKALAERYDVSQATIYNYANKNGRYYAGAGSNNTKTASTRMRGKPRHFSEKQVEEIKTLARAGTPMSEIAKMFGVTYSTVWWYVKKAQ